MHLLGIIEFTSSVLCSRDSLGQAVEISIAGNDGMLILPSLPEWTENEGGHLDKPLVPPKEAKTWKRGDWGRPLSYPTGESQVDKVLLEFTIPSERAEEICQEIYQEFSSWINLFEQYVTLLTTGNKFSFIESGNGSTARLDLLEKKGSGLSHITSKQSETIAIDLLTDQSLHLDELKKACQLASRRLAPRLEYDMLLEAYSARQSADYRKAIVTAATALEICLTSRILKEFKTQRISFGEKLMKKKFRTLGGKFDLIRLLSIPLPGKDYVELILRPRNDVVHKAILPDRKLANQVISEVGELLRAFSPTINQEV